MAETTQKVQRTLIRSTIGVTNIQKSVVSFNKSLNSAQKTTVKVNNTLYQSNRQKRQALSLDRMSFQKRREAVRRREREDIIEASGIGGAFRRQGKVISQSTKGFLGRILDFVGTLMVGWLVVNLPTIIKLGEQLISKIVKLVGVLRGFVTNITTVFSGFGTLISGVFTTLTSFDFNSQNKLIKDGLNTMEIGLLSMERDFKTAVEVLKEPLDLGFDEIDIGQPEAPPGSEPIGGTKYPQLAQVISSGEGSLNSVNRGGAGDTPGGAKSIFGKNLTDMTVGEIMQAQKQGRVFAVGKYQFIPGTLSSAVAYTKIPLDAKFNENTQNRLFDYLIDVKRPIVGQYLSGKSNNRSEAIQELAREFAAVGLEYPEAGRRRGQSRYSGLAGNAASISPDKIGKVLEQQRTAGPAKPTTPTPAVTGKSAVIDTANIAAGGNKIVSLTSGQGFNAPRPGGRTHAGIDINTAGQTGWYVGFKASGTVIFSGVSGGYGNLVIIKSGNTNYYFAHLAKRMVQQGKAYNGEVIGEIGTTGRSTGIHLHYEVRPNGVPVDPKPYLNLLDIGRQIGAKPAPQAGTQITTAAAQVQGLTPEQKQQQDQQLAQERKGQTIFVPLPQEQPPQQSMTMQAGRGGVDIPMAEGNQLNRMIAQKLLLDLAYT